MWWLLAFASAALLGCYDSAKKISLKGNAVIPVLLLNTVFSAIIFSPFLFSTGFGGWEVQKYILMKSALVLSSWMAGYFAMKHLPLTIVGPVNATRPVLVLVGALFLFGERLNLLQWIGVALAVVAYLLLRASGRKEGIGTGNKWILCLILYQAGMMAIVTALLWYPVRKKTTPFHWNWSIPLISLFLCGADYVYMEALSKPEALIAVVSMIRRGSVLVSFAIGAIFLKEKNLKAKALDLGLLLLSMVFLYLGSR